MFHEFRFFFLAQDGMRSRNNSFISCGSCNESSCKNVLQIVAGSVGIKLRTFARKFSRR